MPAPEPIAPVVQAALRSGSDEIRTLLDHLPVGVVVAEAPSGRVVVCNAAACDLWGISLPSDSTVEEYAQRWQGLHPDGRAYRLEEWPLVRAIRLGEVVRDEEMEVLHGDGQRRILRVSATPVVDADGRISLGIATVHDITDIWHHLSRVRLLGEVSEILSTSLDYRVTVQRLADLCVRSLAHYCLVHVEYNGGIHALGVASSGPVPGDAVREWLRHFPVDPQGDHSVAGALRSGESQLFSEFVFERLTGYPPDSERLRLLREAEVASALVIPLKAAGRTLGAITLARTTSSPAFQQEDLELVEAMAARAAHAVDNARLYREARQATRARDELMSVVSHDLRNSLHAALLNVELVLDITPMFSADSPAWRRVSAVRRSLQHMHRLVQDLLEVDRIGRGRLVLQPERLKPQRLVSEVAEIFTPMIQEGGVRLEVRVPDAAPAVLADPARVVQVLNNLIGNALNATPSGGTVEVSVEAESAEWVRFRVADTGAGMSEDELAQIFDRFFQGASARRTGIGLGLTIVRGIVEAHGGRVWAESQPGVGSIFSFTLPRAPE